MAADVTGIFNRALDAIGARSNISLPSEQSREAECCRLWYDALRDQIFAAAPWPDATKLRGLSVLASQDDDEWALGEPRTGYAYSYAVPADMLRPQYLFSGERFQLATLSDNQRVLMTNDAGSTLQYTYRNEVVSLWSPELQMAVTYALAANICQPLTGKTARTKMLIDQANSLILAARITAANTDNEMLDSLPDWISARGYADTSSRSRYTFPFGSMLTTSTANVN